MGFSRQEYWSGVPLPSLWFSKHHFLSLLLILLVDVRPQLPLPACCLSEHLSACDFPPCDAFPEIIPKE